MSTAHLRGSYTVMVTPFTEGGGAVDMAALRRFLDWQVECGVPGVIILGTTGEFLTVSDEERSALVRETASHVDGRMKVLVGAMNAHTPIAVRYAEEAEALGADGLMILPPYYYAPTEDEIMRYYERISTAVTLPIMLYNNPVTSNVDMSADLVVRLATTFENISYIKEASQDVGRIFDIVTRAGGAMEVFAGERIVESCLLGAVGYVNPYGNYIPRASSAILDMFALGQLVEATRVQRLIDRMDHLIAAGHPTYGHQCYSKALAAHAGYPMGDVREPLTTFAQLGAEGRERLAELAKLAAELESMDEVVALRGPYVAAPPQT
jgi:4-hydroxy-tetrahydrodipicolinate synthase